MTKHSTATAHNQTQRITAAQHKTKEQSQRKHNTATQQHSKHTFFRLLAQQRTQNPTVEHNTTRHSAATAQHNTTQHNMEKTKSTHKKAQTQSIIHTTPKQNKKQK